MITNPNKLNFQGHKVFEQPAPKLETERIAAEKITERNPTRSRSMPDPHDLKAKSLDPANRIPDQRVPEYHNNFGQKQKHPIKSPLPMPANPHHLDTGTHASTAFDENVRLVESPTVEGPKHASIWSLPIPATHAPANAPSVGLWSAPEKPIAPSASPTRPKSGEGATSPVESKVFGHRDATLPNRAPTPLPKGMGSSPKETESLGHAGDGSSPAPVLKRPAYDDYNSPSYD
jgi:hypothetical protein